ELQLQAQARGAVIGGGERQAAGEPTRDGPCHRRCRQIPHSVNCDNCRPRQTHSWVIPGLPRAGPYRRMPLGTEGSVNSFIKQFHIVSWGNGPNRKGERKPWQSPRRGTSTRPRRPSV